MVILRNWSFMLYGDGYTAPELWSNHLVGEVYNHPKERHPDGKAVRTSRILKINKNKIECKSRVYTLMGSPDPKWMKWLEDEGTQSQKDQFYPVIEAAKEAAYLN